MRTVILTSLLVLAACSRQPAHPPKSADEIDQLIAIAEAAIDVAQQVYAQAPEPDVQAATLNLRTAFDAAQAQTYEIRMEAAKVDHLARGAVDPMGVGGCIGAHLVEIQDIDRFSSNARMLWSIKVGECAAATLVSFNTAPAPDHSSLALALTIIDPIMLVARARSGLRRGGLLHYLDSTKSVIAKLGPECEKNLNSSDAGEVSYECAAYQVAIAVRPKVEALANVLQSRRSP